MHINGIVNFDTRFNLIGGPISFEIRDRATNKYCGHVHVIKGKFKNIILPVFAFTDTEYQKMSNALCKEIHDIFYSMSDVNLIVTII